jgi:uncharacterized protein YqjF (DUF2071 family)
MFQRWRNISFLHWRYPEHAVARLLPSGLTVDTFDGSAWVGITPFVLSGLHAPFLPPLPWISRFPETNCRTYVRGPDGAPGIWFFSLDAARLGAVLAARAAYGLPYAWSQMDVAIRRDRFTYTAARRWPGAAAYAITVYRGRPVATGELESFLTARFRLYSTILGRLATARVEHPPWPLESARTLQICETLTAAAGLAPPHGAPVTHFSAGVRTRVGYPELV